jgi:transposase
MESGYRLLVGIDWATEGHQVCVLDSQGRLLEQRRVEHRAEVIAAMIDRLIELAGGDPASIAVAIEVPRGAVVEALVERGLHVFAINPKQLDRFRDRHTVAGAKDDRRDAFVLADSLRTDLSAFRRIHLDDAWTIQIRELTRVEEDLKTEINRMANQLRDLLLRFYPQLLRLCPAADQPWLWALLKLAPTPTKAQRLRRSSIERLLHQYRIRKWTADQVRTELKTAPLSVAPGVTQATSAHIALLLPRMELLMAQLKLCSKAVEAALDEKIAEQEQRREHRDVVILLSLPGVGRVVAATMLAEASQLLAQRNYHALRTLGGIAPVTRQSGKRLAVRRRYGCNQRLNNAFHHWARVSSQCDPRAKHHYQTLRQIGHSHGRALRGVADRLLALLVAMLRDQTLYDTTRAHAPNPIAT